MPFSLDDCLQVTIMGNTADGAFANVLHLNINSVGVGQFLCARNLLDNYCTNILPVLCSSVHVEKAHYIDLTGLDGASGDVFPSPGVDQDGGVGTQACPPQVSYLAKLLTNSTRGTRSGRMYLPGVRLDEVSGSGDIGDTTVAAVTAACGDFLTTSQTDDSGNLSVVHKPEGLAPSMDEVLQINCEVPVATQRRRLKR